jgi:alanine racemase
MTVGEPIRIDAPLLSEPPSWLEIDLGRLEANVKYLRAALDADAVTRPDPLMRPGKDRKAPLLCGVVKKNAYGLGIEQVSQRLVQAGVDILAVYAPDNADLIIRAAVNIPILLLMPLRTLRRTDPLYRAAETGRLHLTIHDMQQLDELNSVGQTYGLKLPVHLHLDTGMSRSGLDAEQFVAALGRLSALPHLRLRGVYSHLATACSDHEYAYRQLEYFEKMIADHADKLPDSVVLHLANTCGAYRDRRFHMDMVRIGLGLYGYGPESITDGPIVAEAPILLPIVKWLSRLVHVQRYPAGASVGYGCTHTLKRDSVLGVIPVGYGDGYPLSLSNKGTVVIRDDATNHAYRAPVLGRVNMDQIVVDLTDCADALTPEVGTMVEVISSDPASPCALPHLAELAHSSCYEMLCRLSSRLPRRYVKSSAVEDV